MFQQIVLLFHDIYMNLYQNKLHLYFPLWPFWPIILQLKTTFQSLVFLALISFSIDDAETKVLLFLSSIICAERLFNDFDTSYP